MALTNDDLLAISQLLDTKLQNFATREELDSKLRELENNILEEVDTVQEKANDHFKRVEKRLDDIETEVHASKLQNDTLNLLLRRIDLMQDEINELKKKVS
jgi:uncharacterized protein involved in exopolysaccharide biosynthesis